MHLFGQLLAAILGLPLELLEKVCGARLECAALFTVQLEAAREVHIQPASAHPTVHGEIGMRPTYAPTP